jgi:CRISPR-associated exonuclease Cas4
MEHITGTLISYYFYCKRRMWLHANDIRFESTSDDVILGLLVEEQSFQQRNSQYQQLEIDHIKIDFYDSKSRVIHETKKSNKFEECHIWQLKYYIYILKENGLENVKGLLEYPTEHKTIEVILEPNDCKTISEIEDKMLSTIKTNQCPPILSNSIKCHNCSYYEFCYTEEEDSI